LKAKRYKILAVIAISIGLFFRIIDRLWPSIIGQIKFGCLH
jgi:hypothetical protein